MNRYKIEVKEILSRVIEVEDNLLDDAVSNVENLYRSEKIVLDYDDFVKVEIREFKEEEIIEEKTNLIKDVINYLIEEEKRHFEEFETKPEDHIYLKLKRLTNLI